MTTKSSPDSPEAAILRRILLRLGSMIGTRLFRNTVGVAYVGRIVEKTGERITLSPYRVVTHGLAPGSSDLIGWHTRTITAADVGKRVAVFLAVEVKAAQGTLEPEQSAFLAAVERAGGIGIVSRHEDDAAISLDRAGRAAE